MNKVEISHKMWLVRNSGPEDKMHMYDTIEAYIKDAERDVECKLISWAGPFDILVTPTGYFSFVSSERKLYRLVPRESSNSNLRLIEEVL